MSHRLLIPILAAVGLLTSCQGSGSPISPVASPVVSGSQPAQPVVASLGAVGEYAGYIDSALGLYSLSIDAVAGSATSELLATRSLQDNDDLYELSITNFLRRDSFTITGVTRTATTLDLDYSFAHPFPAPQDPMGSPNGSTNRADLGVAGRLLVLADVATSTGNTFFTDVVANTALLTNADAYYQPAGLLNLTATANAFPYKLLVDESGPDGNRAGIPNGGDPTGNYGVDGWTRAEFGANNDGWTGYGVLHQGQVSRDTLSFDLNELASGLDLTIAVLAKYNDPRGGLTSVEKRGNRLPPASPDHTKFAYRMPHGALDVEGIRFEGESGGFQANSVTASTLRFRVVDWDARATETGFADLFEDGDLNAVAAGESGAPSLAVCIPGVLGDATTEEAFDATDLLDDDSAVGGDVDVDSGRPADALFFERLITKPVGSGQVGGTYTGLVRASDPEPTGLVIALDGTTLAPLSSGLPEAVTYQAFAVEMIEIVANFPPEVNGTIGLKLRNPCMPSPATFIIENKDVVVTDPESDAITYTVVATPDVGAPVTVSGITAFPISNAATGPWSNPSTTEVTFQIYANDALHPGTSGTPMPVITAPNPLVGTVTIPNPWANVWGASSAQGYDTTVAPNGDVFVCGYFQGNADLDPGAGVDNKVGIGNWDVFVSKFDSSGVYQWGRHWGGTIQDYAQSVAIDNAGNSYIGGRFETANVDFDPGAGSVLRSSVGGYDAFVVSLDPSGNFRWVGTWGGAGADWVFEVGVDQGGTPTMVGRGSGTIDYDPGPGVQNIAGPGGDDSFLLQLNPADGSYVRALVMGNAVADNFYTMAFDNAGGLFLSGSMQSTFDMDPGPGVVNRTSTFASNPYILKLNAATLAYEWDAHLQVQIPVGSAHYGLATDPSGDVYYTAGYASHPVNDVDAGPGTAILPMLASGQDPFLVAYTSDGQYKWHSYVTGNGLAADWGHDLVATDDTVFWIGDFAGTAVDFDPSPMTFPLSSPSGSSNAFIASFESRYGCFQGAATIGGTSTDIAYGAGLTGLCDPVWSGTTQTSLDYDPGPGTQIRPAVGSFTAWQSRINGGTLSF